MPGNTVTHQKKMTPCKLYGLYSTPYTWPYLLHVHCDCLFTSSGVQTKVDLLGQSSRVIFKYHYGPLQLERSLCISLTGLFPGKDSASVKLWIWRLLPMLQGSDNSLFGSPVTLARLWYVEY